MFYSLPSVSLSTVAAAVEVVEERCIGEDTIQTQIEKRVAEDMYLLFYNEKDPVTEWLGNFYPIQVEYNGLVFSNSEAAYQAQKFVHYPELMQGFTHLSAEEAFWKARNLKEFVRSDWLDVNVEVMKSVLQAKIAQHPQLAHWLESTDQALLVEHNPKKGRDSFWSDDCDGSGQNRLGKLWMEIRAEQRHEPWVPIDSTHLGWQNYQKFLKSLEAR